MAGDLGSVAAFFAILVFLARPLNDPIWAWFRGAGVLRALLVAGAITAFMICLQARANTAQSCAREIYGSLPKALAYRLGSCLLMLGGLVLAVQLHRN